VTEPEQTAAKPGPPRRGRLIAAAVALTVAASLGSALALSPRLRASFAAAYKAFRDPARVDPSATTEPVTGSARDGQPAQELEQFEIASDFERATEADYADAGPETLATLTMPDLPFPVSRRAMRFVHYFATGDKGRKAFLERFRRGGRYRPHIEQALRDAGLPEDLVWLVAIESAFNPQAVSPAGAAGLFQFMPETAARYGLAQTEYVDERKSITKATAAGVQHLRDLYDKYRQWDLALAAYNYGHEQLDASIEKLKAKRGRKDANKPIEIKDLAEARLIPKETANFVPQIQAFAIVAANRGRFGLDDLDAAPPFEFGEIAVPAGTQLKTISKAAGISIATLRDLNPDLLRDRVPPTGGDSMVNLPSDRLQQAVASIPIHLAREAAEQRVASEDGAREPKVPRPKEPKEEKPPRDEPAKPAESQPQAAVAPKPTAPGREPQGERRILSNGITLAFADAAARDPVVTARVEILEASRAGLRESGKAFETAALPAAGSLDAAMDRAAEQLRKLVDDGGEAAAYARVQGGQARRTAIDKMPYGAAWTALGDKLFPKGHPLSGLVLAAPTLPLMSVVHFEHAPRSALRVRVTVAGVADKERATRSAERAFAGVFRGAAVAPHPREERVSVSDAVPASRVLFGWIGPGEDEGSAAVMRLAMMMLAHNKNGRVARALVSEKFVASHVRGSLDATSRATIAVIEVVPAVPHDAEDVVRELTLAIEKFADAGPNPMELRSGKEVLRAFLQGERARAGTGAEPKNVAVARIDRLAKAVEDLAEGDVRAMVKKVFSPQHRVIVVTTPRR
jgi:soluble lytic murein transglycosylase-like protein